MTVTSVTVSLLTPICKYAYHIVMNAYDIHQVIQHFGSKAALAKALRIEPQAIYQWKRIPPRRALEIEKLTSGLFKAHDPAGEDVTAAN